MAEKIKEQFKHTSARTVASNSDLDKRLKGREQLGEMQLGHSPGHPPALLGAGITAPATTGDVNHLISYEYSKVGGREH